jgi:protein SCO1/2
MVAVPLALAALAALALVAVGVGGGGSGPALNATPVDPPVPAPAVSGTDQDGRPVALPQAGRPMVATFLFTRCPTTCPLISQQLAAALDMLGPEADAVDVVAISVDPQGDTPARARAFLRSHGLEDRMRYVVGSRAELAPIWDAWQVAAQPADQPSLSIHSARIVLVDASGRQVGRYAAGLPIPPADIAEDVASLVG